MFSFLIVLLASILVTQPAWADIDSVRVVGDGELTRITMWSDRALAPEAFLTQEADQPRILVSFETSAGQTGPGVSVPRATGVSGYGWDAGFLAFTLARPMMVSRILELPPVEGEPRHRIVIDLAGVSQARFERSAERSVAVVARRRELHLAGGRARSAPVQASLQPAPLGHDVVLDPVPVGGGNYLIVIDPGHGGRDPGAIAPTGLKEKDVVLAAARTLKELLEADARFSVRLTREDDRFIELEDRVTLARQWGADLFISLHADAAEDGDVEGASVYTISERGEARIDREAEKNNWHFEVEATVPDDTADILQALLRRETKTNSGLFASLLLPELAEAGPVVRNTHREAGFYVLLAPDVPAVLLEMGFLTNRADARRLADASRRREAMEAVRDAIDAYFDRQDLIFASN